MGIFEPFRAIGYTTSDVPFSVQRMGTETFVTVSVGKAWQIFNCAKLNLVLVGSQLQKKIRALASYHEFTFAAVGNDIAVFKRAHQVLTWCRHESKIKLLLLFGEHILSVDVAGNMFIWPIKGIGNMMDPDGHIIFQDKFTPTCLIHPDTYMNKVVVGTQEGKFELWNISTKKKIHAFKGWDLPICCCVSSPALDVIAFGCADGKVHLHNIRFDKEIVTFSHLARGAVSSLSFCTDGRPLLAAGGSSGMISIWNLEKRRLHSVIKEAHAGPVISLHFFANEPVLMSSAKDNAIKMWIFDNSDGDARLLRFRSGHSAPPVCMRFYANGKHILSAGYDRSFRLFSVIQDQQSRELSQRHTSNRAKKLKIKEEDVKLKPVISFDFSEIRERDWCNVVSCHMDTPRAYVWRLQNSVLGELVLKPSKQSAVKTCTVSVCGNFAIIGTEGGWVESFNLQSGISRGSFMDPDEGSKCAHSGEVAGIACNASNSLLISVGYRGDIKLWDFKRLAMKSRWEVGGCVARVVFQRTSGLLAVACDDFTIRLFDVVSERAVRRFEGHADRVTDMCFSEDGKWLLSSGMDGSVRTWDVVVGRQIDVMSVDVCVTALSLSPDMDLLATTHTGQNGIYLWANRAMFSAVAEKKNGPVVMPADEHWRGEEPGMITLSLLPKSQWQSLVQLDLIRERNRPIQPPSKPEPAPFFLPSVPTLSGEVEFRLADKQTVAERGVDAITPKSLTTETVLSELLRACAHLGDFSSFTDYIKGMSPAALDMELRLLQILNEDEETVKESPELGVLGLLLDYFVGQVSCGNDFEFVQAAIHVFLKIHGDAVRREESLLVKAQSLLDVQLTTWQSIDAMFQSSRCMLTFLTDSQF